MKKILIGMLLVCVAALSFAKGAQEGSAAEKKVVDMKYYFVLPNQPDEKEVFKIAQDYVLEKTGVNLEFINFPMGDYFQKMNVKLNANEDMDLVWNCHWNIQVGHQVRATEGAWIALDELLPLYAPKTYEFLGQFVEGEFWDYMKIDGNIYGVFNFQQLAASKGLWFKKEYLEKFNFDPESVKELEDLEPFLESVKQNEPGITPLLIDKQGFVSNLPFDGAKEPIARYANSYVTYDEPEPEKLKNRFKEPYNLWAYEKTIEWARKGYIRGDAITIERWIDEGKNPVYGCGILGGYMPDASITMTKNWGYDVVAVPFQEPEPYDYRTGFATVTSVHNTCEEPELAVQVIELLNSDPYFYNLLVFGIEDKHYTKISDKSIKLIPDSGYNALQFKWVIGNTSLEYLPEEYPADYNEQMVAISRKVIPGLYPDFKLGELPDANLTFNTLYVDEYIKPLNVGKLPEGLSSAQEVFDFIATEAEELLDEVDVEVKNQLTAYVESREQ